MTEEIIQAKSLERYPDPHYVNSNEQPRYNEFQKVDFQQESWTEGALWMQKEMEQKLTIEQIVEEVIQVCKEYAEDGCFDADGAEANSLRIIKKMLTP